VRACAAPFGDLTALTPALGADVCGPDTPMQMGGLTELCLKSPAPLVLLLADNAPDRCHGGGPDSLEPDGEPDFNAHAVTRLDAFIAGHRPSLMLVGPRTEWRPAPTPPMAMLGPDPVRCGWARGDWDRGALASWAMAHPDDRTVMIEDDLHDESKRHHPCCQMLGVPCATHWYEYGPAGGSLLNRDGADALVDFWYARLKKLLLSNKFQCP
jgi:hypothetical protein